MLHIPLHVDWLNYHHLHYFMVVAREGGLVPAGRALRLSHPTLSAQIHALEDQLGEKLFTKVGRKLVLTDIGKIVFRYADEIFSLGREMVSTVRERPTGQPVRLAVGVVDVLPKLVVRRLLEPALEVDGGLPVRLICYENNYEKLLTELAVHNLDIVLSDMPVPSGSSVRAFHHLLGESGITFFGKAELAERFKKGFPKSLHGAPLLLPLENLMLRRSLNQWFDGLEIHPTPVAEFEDSALLTVFGADGHGLFPAPTAVESEMVEQHGVVVVGRTNVVKERFYAISVEKRLKHPAVVAMLQAARREVFKSSAIATEASASARSAGTLKTEGALLREILKTTANPGKAGDR